jgi:hypothetical protein
MRSPRDALRTNFAFIDRRGNWLVFKMQSLLQKLRAASADHADEAVKHLLTEAVNEIERLQRAAYQGSAARPFNFETVQVIRRRHLEDKLSNNFDARQAHEDRAQLLAILAFTSKGAHEGAPSASADWQDLPTKDMPFMIS